MADKLLEIPKCRVFTCEYPPNNPQLIPFGFIWVDWNNCKMNQLVEAIANQFPQVTHVYNMKWDKHGVYGDGYIEAPGAVQLTKPARPDLDMPPNVYQDRW